MENQIKLANFEKNKFLNMDNLPFNMANILGFGTEKQSSLKSSIRVGKCDGLYTVFSKLKGDGGSNVSSKIFTSDSIIIIDKLSLKILNLRIP